jgi:hypothetical protein
VFVGEYKTPEEVAKVIDPAELVEVSYVFCPLTIGGTRSCPV